LFDLISLRLNLHFHRIGTMRQQVSYLEHSLFQFADEFANLLEVLGVEEFLFFPSAMVIWGVLQLQCSVGPEHRNIRKSCIEGSFKRQYGMITAKQVKFTIFPGWSHPSTISSANESVHLSKCLLEDTCPITSVLWDNEMPWKRMTAG
jgi:hypothetical protein